MDDVVLAVHSYAGMLGTAVADRLPQRLARLPEQRLPTLDELGFQETRTAAKLAAERIGDSIRIVDADQAPSQPPLIWQRIGVEEVE